MYLSSGRYISNTQQKPGAFFLSLNKTMNIYLFILIQVILIWLTRARFSQNKTFPLCSMVLDKKKTVKPALIAKPYETMEKGHVKIGVLRA